jgi:hypothetical protein
MRQWHEFKAQSPPANEFSKRFSFAPWRLCVFASNPVVVQYTRTSTAADCADFTTSSNNGRAALPRSPNIRAARQRPPYQLFTT